MADTFVLGSLEDCSGQVAQARQDREASARRPGWSVARLAALLLIVVTAVAAVPLGWAGYLRLTGNIHEFEPGLYRSGQLSGERLARFIREHGIMTVLNLRGASPGRSWYDGEARAARETGVTYIVVGLSASHEPDGAAMASLVEALKTAPKPLLLHCEAGADRSGLAAALYELLVMHRPAPVAREQLSFRYGHFPWLLSRSGAMDRAFDRAAAAAR